MLALSTLCSLTLLVPALAGDPPPSPPNEEEIVLGTPSRIQAFESPAEVVLVAAGTRIYALPDGRSTLVAVVDVEAPREVVERAGGWAMVRVDGQGGWVATRDGSAGPGIESEPAAGPLGDRQAPLSPQPDRLARARSLLAGETVRQTSLFRIHADLADAKQAELVSTLAENLPSVYEKRYGLAPAAGDLFAVVVFASEADYRAFERDDRELAELGARGHAAGNIAALYTEGRDRAEVGPILLHEMTHLLNQSVFRGRLPPWLEEGMAEDLSYARITPSLKIDLRRLGGVDRRYLELADDGSRTFVTELWGAPATLSRLAEALRVDGLMSLPDLMSLSRHEMSRPEGRSLRYGQSAFFVRYLLDGAGTAGRQGLGRYLRRVAAAESSGADELAALIGSDWEDLAQGFARWLTARSRTVEPTRVE